MAKAQAHYQGPADRQWEPTPDFQVGQQVYVSAEHTCTTRPSKKLSERYLGPLISSHVLAHIPFPFSLPSTYVLSIWFSMFHSQNPWCLTQFPTIPSHPHHLSRLMARLSTRLLIFLTPRLTISINANSYTMSSGQVTKALMKKLHGY